MKILIQDIYDTIIPNITIPHIDGLEETLAVSNMISQSVNVAGMSAALFAVSSVAASIHTEPLEGAITACNMVSSTINNSVVESSASAATVLSDIYDSPAIQAASEAAQVVSENVSTIFLKESLEATEAVIANDVSPVTSTVLHIAEIFAGIGGLTQLISESITSRMQELYEHMHEFIHAMAERFRQFMEDFISYYTETKLLPAAITYDPVLTINCTGPPTRISKFSTYSYRIRKIYLRHSRERGTSDDADYTLTFCNLVNSATC